MPLLAQAGAVHAPSRGHAQDARRLSERPAWAKHAGAQAGATSVAPTGRIWATDDTHRCDATQALVMTTSRYSPGTTSEAVPAVFSSSSSPVMSCSSASWPTPSSAANALSVGP
jgi:hypothetical protein